MGLAMTKRCYVLIYCWFGRACAAISVRGLSIGDSMDVRIQRSFLRMVHMAATL